MNHLFLHCRPGFEKECAAEVSDLATQNGIYGYCKTEDHAAYVLFISHDPEGASRLIECVNFRELIFVRQWFVCAEPLQNMPQDNRIDPLFSAMEAFALCRELSIEMVDTNDGKALAALAKKIQKPFLSLLNKRARLRSKSNLRLHLVFLSGSEAVIGYAPIANSSANASGIPRLKVPKDAPSRATLKLEEAWHHFIPAAEWDQRLAGGMRAVDLGAAPGGWTYQLVKRSMFVDAVDNGPMQQALMDTGQVTHRRADGFVYEPQKPVHWLVCDIVDKPMRVADMICRWIGNNWCAEAVFNLKLPMKQRYLEVQKCRNHIVDTLRAGGVEVELNFKQLYHDREEVTGHIRRL